jgi:hypothetical protein
MECQAHHKDVRRGNGGYPAATLEELERSGSTYLPFIPSFLRRPLQKDNREDQ